MWNWDKAVSPKVIKSLLKKEINKWQYSLVELF